MYLVASLSNCNVLMFAISHKISITDCVFHCISDILFLIIIIIFWGQHWFITV